MQQISFSVCLLVTTIAIPVASGSTLNNSSVQSTQTGQVESPVLQEPTGDLTLERALEAAVQLNPALVATEHGVSAAEARDCAIAGSLRTLSRNPSGRGPGPQDAHGRTLIERPG